MTVRRLPAGGVKATASRDGGDYSFDFYMEAKNVALTKVTHRVLRLGPDGAPSDDRHYPLAG